VEEENHTFEPQVNKKKSRKIKGCFLSRQQAYEKKKQENKIKLNRSLDCYSFKPVINSNTNELIQTAANKKKMIKLKLGCNNGMRTYIKE